jgi:dTDP-glucose 4,6-dehydratase
VREWLFVEDFCEAIITVRERGRRGEIYNVGSGELRTNLSVAADVLKALGKSGDLIRHVVDRPGHDRRYALVSKKIRALGWAPRHRFENALVESIRWYQQHPQWWEPLKERVVLKRTVYAAQRSAARNDADAPFSADR